jgi:hypothetical protein
MDVHRASACIHRRSSRFRNGSGMARRCRVNPVAVKCCLQENCAVHFLLPPRVPLDKTLQLAIEIADALDVATQ